MAETITRRELIRKLRNLGFDGPFPGGRHHHMRKGNLRVTIPNPHHGDIEVHLLHRILRQGGIVREEWDRA